MVWPRPCGGDVFSKEGAWGPFDLGAFTFPGDLTFTTEHWLQLIEILVFLVGFVLTIRGLRQTRDSRNIDFIIHGEGQIDPLFISLLNSPPSTVRQALPGVFPKDVDDGDVHSYLAVYVGYRHLSRMFYMLSNENVSIGMTKSERAAMRKEWILETKKYNQNILLQIHLLGRETGEFNDGFMRYMDRHLGL